jgi:hypothetical protein
MKQLTFITILLTIFSAHIQSFAQSPKTKSNTVYVDDKGVMRWGDSNVEVQGFGINYTVPFAHAYRAASRLGVPHQEAIDNDVYHFARLGFDAYRVHVWDTEISDTVGNLLVNHHLELFDYMLGKMKERQMKFILTPIAFWGNGYPDPDEKTPGFAHKYGKDNCLTNEEAIRAQENYLFQFLNHVNPRTGIAYKDDPDIVAFEISNEPHHKEAPEKVTKYISRMVAAMRRTGCSKPILYNISHSIHLVNAYFDAGIQGGTFQWYPTGLGAQEELWVNFLPNVDRYNIPFAANPAFKKGAKIVYEFDAADVGRSYIYPAMARSFRTAGIQWATHFAYDPTFMAFANTEYNTHFMNLAYAPQKALSLKLASKVFHNIPMYKDFGKYPANTRFGPFRVSYEEDLAEMLTDKKFIYTNHTASAPASPEKLEEIAGYGNSAVVKYEGGGAYFLDRLEKGVWRLEVMPDAVWIKDPFGRNSLARQVAAVNWRTWPMTITLPDLGEDFSVRAINEKNQFTTAVSGRSFAIAPGTYLVAKKGVALKQRGDERWKNIVLKEFSAPAADLKKIVVLHQPAPELAPGNPYVISATVASVNEPESVEVTVYAGFRPKVYAMQRTSGYRYMATLPAEAVQEGFLRYFITVKENGKMTSFPSGAVGDPRDLGFSGAGLFEVKVVDPASPLYLFNALTDNDALSRPWIRGLSFVPKAEPGKAEIRVSIEKLFTVDPENPGAGKIHDYAMRYYFGDKIKGRKAGLAGKKEIIFTGRALNGKPCWLQVALVTRHGAAYGGLIKVEPESKQYKLALSELKKVKLVTLPRPYPTFLAYFFENGSTAKFDLNEVESLQISIGPGIPESEIENSHGIAIESVHLE